jgi:hypothetical protein
LKAPEIKAFVLSHANASTLPLNLRTALANKTLYVNSGANISVRSHVFDADSGVASYKIVLRGSVNLTENQQSITSERQVIEETFMDLSKFALVHNMTYTLSIEAIDRAGLHAMPLQAFLFVDDSPATPGKVLDGASEIFVHCQGSTRVIFVEWTPFLEPETKVLFHQVAVASAADPLQQDLAKFGKEVEASQVSAYVEFKPEVDNVLRPGDKIFVSIRATNVAGLSSLASSGPLNVSCATQQCQCSGNVVCL